MRPCACSLLVAVALVGLAGCGTVSNLMAPPTPNEVDMLGLGLNSCEPFGGAKRSLVLGVGLGAVGAFEGAQHIGQGGLLMGAGGLTAGLAIIAVDAPLSLVGDVVTWPVACARKQQEPWATWWGEQAGQKGDSLKRFWLGPPLATVSPRAEDRQPPATPAPDPTKASESP